MPRPRHILDACLSQADLAACCNITCLGYDRLHGPCTARFQPKRIIYLHAGADCLTTPDVHKGMQPIWLLQVWMQRLHVYCICAPMHGQGGDAHLHIHDHVLTSLLACSSLVLARPFFNRSSRFSICVTSASASSKLIVSASSAGSTFPLT